MFLSNLRRFSLIDMEHFNQFFPAICAGLGLFLAGAVNVVLLRRGVAVRVIATVLAFALALAAANSIDQPGTVVGTARLLGVGLIAFAILACRPIVRGATLALTFATRPLVSYSLLALAGVGLAVGSALIHERADQAMIDQYMSDMELFHSKTPSTPVDGEKGTTDLGSRVILRQPTEARDISRLSDTEERFFRTSQLREQVIRQSAADDHSNCHGWVFTAGRFILNPEDVELILKDNGYTLQSIPQPGDLAIYRTNGTVAHTAVVQYVADGQPVLVRGKWGNLGVFLHHADKSPYGTDYAFYRSPRSGHLIATSPTSSGETQPAAAE
jgi:hypothetical protein